MIQTRCIPCGSTITSMTSEVKFPKSELVLHLNSSSPLIIAMTSVMKVKVFSYEQDVLLKSVTSVEGVTGSKSSALFGPSFTQYSINICVASEGFPMSPVQIIDANWPSTNRVDDIIGAVAFAEENNM